MSGRWVEVEPGRQRFIRDRQPEPELARSDLPIPYIVSDLPAYASPLGDGMIDGRAARREHFRRTNTREVDPSEWRERSAKFKAEKAEKQAIADAWRAGKNINRGTA
ncbi:hypothetical protein CN138_09110 [Sinorhizobium meliloti]|uniref:hypothetical protein n=1 Tax=Rhizobium meliloti TaxID=382 RepID=UPI000FD3A157|nr:hypothetical protein [Sinorhizobium meliloti]RVL48478.1 hypothetical protein CN145_23235 [Sinorhizobium meliloti]RVL72411.1 hypothetical protein CN138_09110 [Sinorhizobium meliloti]